MGLNPTRGSIFFWKSDCLGCAVLLCLVVCITLLAVFSKVIDPSSKEIELSWMELEPTTGF